MYKYFYITMLIGAILVGIISLIGSNRPNKIWLRIMNGLIVITVVALMGFIIALM